MVNSVKIGNFEIVFVDDYRIWLYNSDGEGIQVDIKELNELFKEFFNRKF